MPPEDTQTNPEAPPPSRADRIGAGRSGSGAARWWWVGGGAAVVVIAVVAFVVIHDRGNGGAAPIIPSPLPSRAAFTFPTPSVSAVTMGTAKAKGAETVAAKVQLTLSDYYDFAFLDPSAWAGTTPAQAWAQFSSGTAVSAKQDEASLTLSAAGGKVASLKVSSSSMRIRILFDAHGKALEAIATVSFHAGGTMKDGSAVQVVSTGSYLLQQVGGKWLITGFPHVTTTVDAPAGA